MGIKRESLTINNNKNQLKRMLIKMAKNKSKD